MRILCLPCSTDFVWINYDAENPQSLWFLQCPACNKLAIPPRPKMIDAQSVLDTLLSVTASGGDYYDEERMRVLLQ